MSNDDVVSNTNKNILQAQLLIDYPTEVLVRKFYNGLLILPTGSRKWFNKLQLTQLLINKALEHLPREMGVRGPKAVLKAIEEVETLKGLVDELYTHIPTDNFMKG